MLPTSYNHRWEPYRRKDQRQSKRQGENCNRLRRIRKADYGDLTLTLRQSWSRRTHRPPTLAKRSNRISITAAMLNTRSARLRESRQARSGRESDPLACRQ